MFDITISHVTLRVADLTRSSEFYAKYTGMELVHWRHDTNGGADVAWLGNRTTPFGVILIKGDVVPHPLFPMTQLGVTCKSRGQMDRLCAEAERDNALVKAPIDWGYPLGYWALLRDPDGHMLTLSYGHRIGATIENESGPLESEPAAPDRGSASA